MSKSKSSTTSGLIGGLIGVALGAIGGFFLYKFKDEIMGDENNKEKEVIPSGKIINDKKEENKENNINTNESNYMKTVTSNDSDSFEDMISCPITCNIMNDPVITPHGISYEKKAIVDWLSKNNFCPITKKGLKENELTPNYKLKEIIDNYKRNKSSISQ